MINKYTVCIIIVRCNKENKNKDNSNDNLSEWKPCRTDGQIMLKQM